MVSSGVCVIAVRHWLSSSTLRWCLQGSVLELSGTGCPLPFSGGVFGVCVIAVRHWLSSSILRWCLQGPVLELSGTGCPLPLSGGVFRGLCYSCQALAVLFHSQVVSSGVCVIAVRHWLSSSTLRCCLQGPVLELSGTGCPLPFSGGVFRGLC